MGVLRSRSRLVTFRLDPDEYAELRAVCVRTGARSISEFARESVLASVQAGSAAKANLGGDLVTLTNRLHELDKLLKMVTSVLARVLGAGDPDHPHAGGAGSA